MERVVDTVLRLLGARAACAAMRAVLVAVLMMLISKHLLRWLVGSVVIFFAMWLLALTGNAIWPENAAIVNEYAPYFVYAALVIFALWELKEVVREINRKVMQDLPRRIPAVSKVPIPLPAKYVVYYRDKGSCRRCGAYSDLGYDHIVPWRHGGRNEVKNIELRCGNCSSYYKTKTNRYVYLEDRRLRRRAGGNQ